MSHLTVMAMHPVMKVWLATVMIVFFLLNANGIQEITLPVKLKQVGSLKHYHGTLPVHGGSSAVFYWSIGRFGKSFPISDYHLRKNQRHVYIFTM